MTKTLRQQVIDRLINAGFTHNTQRSTGKLECYEWARRPDRRIFVGQRAAVRIGPTASLSTAFKGVSFTASLLPNLEKLIDALIVSPAHDEKGRPIDSDEIRKEREQQATKDKITKDLAHIHSMLRYSGPSLAYLTCISDESGFMETRTHHELGEALTEYQGLVCLRQTNPPTRELWVRIRASDCPTFYTHLRDQRLFVNAGMRYPACEVTDGPLDTEKGREETTGDEMLVNCPKCIEIMRSRRDANDKQH